MKDVINRYHLLQGHRVHFVPGWDCHGLPIEIKALQQEGKDFKTIKPTEIREKGSVQCIYLCVLEVQGSEFQCHSFLILIKIIQLM